MLRTLGVAAAVSSTLVPAPAADASVCAGRRFIEGWTGACVLGRDWVACAVDANMYPALYVYVPGPGSGGETCGP